MRKVFWGALSLFLLSLVAVKGTVLAACVIGPDVVCSGGSIGHSQFCCSNCYIGWKDGVQGCIADCNDIGPCPGNIVTWGPEWCDASACCTASCPTACGQSDGCTGTCGTSDIGNYSQTGYFCESNCGNYTCYNTYADPCGNWQWTPVGGGCNECGPSYGAWGACTAPSFTRSRDYTYDCAAPGTQTEACVGSFTGTLFDASVPNDCSTYATEPPIVGATVTATGQINGGGTFNATTNSSGNYTISGARVPETYDLTFTADTTKYIADPPKLLCDGGLTGLSLNGQGQSYTRRIGLYRIYGGWFQSSGGDIYGHTGVSESVPATCALAANQATCNSYDSGGTTYTPLVARPDYGGTPGSSGVVFSKNGSLSLGGGGTAAPNAVFSFDGYNSTNAGYSGRRFDYGYFFRWIGNLGSTSWDGVGKPTGAANALYRHVGALTWGQSLDAGDKIVILNDGDVTVNANVTVPLGAYLAIIANGNITFTSGVTNAQGHYVANTLTVAGTGDTSTDQRFQGEGSFIGWDGVILERDRGITNNSESSEYFVARPDLVINAPLGIRNPKIDWHEVAP